MGIAMKNGRPAFIDGSFFEKRVDKKLVLTYVSALRNKIYRFETQMPGLSPITYSPTWNQQQGYSTAIWKWRDYDNLMWSFATNVGTMAVVYARTAWSGTCWCLARRLILPWNPIIPLTFPSTLEVASGCHLGATNGAKCQRSSLGTEFHR